MATVFASITAPGPQGPPGRTSLWLTGTGAPVSAQGLDGDMYLDSATGNVYGPKALSVWGPVVANIKGVPGATGPTGPAGYSPRYIVGTAPPTVGTGNDGDMFLNQTTSDLYGPKTAGAWGPVVANVKGPTGAQGPPGVAYTPRGAWNSATDYHQGDMVSDASIAYIALQGPPNVNHVPFGNPTWWQPVAQGGSQTPWQSNIDAFGFNLTGVGQLAVGLTSPLATLHVRSAANQNLQIGSMAWALAGAVGLNAVNDANNAVIPLVVNSSVTGFFGPVGIGTVAPQAPLQVLKTPGIGAPPPAGTYGGTAIFSGDSTLFGLYIGSIATTGAGYIQQQRGDSATTYPLLIQPNGGNVGIGVIPASTSRLHVLMADAGTAVFSSAILMLQNSVNTAGTGNAIQSMNAGGGVTSEIRFINGPGTGIYPNNGGSIAFSTYDGVGGGGTERMRITAAGMVGIGQIPNTDVRLAVLAYGAIAIRLTATGANNCQLRFAGNATPGDLWAIGTDIVAGNGGRDFTFYDMAAGVRMTIDGSGHVGIGMGPDAKLAVGGNLHVASDSVGGGGASQVAIGGLTDTRKNLWLAFDTTANIGLVQAGISGVSWNPLVLNGAGGNVGIGTGTATVLTPLQVKVAADYNFGVMASTANATTIGAFNDVFNAWQPLSINPSSAVYLCADAGAVSIGNKSSQATKLSVTPQVNATTVATANHVTIGEATNSGGYYMSLGYFLDGSSIWKASIQALSGGSATNLVINGLGGGVGVCKVSPINYALDVAGDVNCSGSFRVNGTPISTGGSGGVTVQTAGMAGSSRLIGNTYQNTFSGGKPVLVTVTCNCNAAGSFWANCNSTNSFGAGNQVAQTTSQNASQVLSISFWVLPNYYYAVSTSGSVNLTFWTEWY